MTTEKKLTQLSNDLQMMRLTLSGMYIIKSDKDETYERFLKEKEEPISKLSELMDTFIDEVIEWRNNN